MPEEVKSMTISPMNVSYIATLWQVSFIFILIYVSSYRLLIDFSLYYQENLFLIGNSEVMYSFCMFNFLISFQGCQSRKQLISPAWSRLLSGLLSEWFLPSIILTLNMSGISRQAKEECSTLSVAPWPSRPPWSPRLPIWSSLTVHQRTWRMWVWYICIECVRSLLHFTLWWVLIGFRLRHCHSLVTVRGVKKCKKTLLR